MRQLTMSVIAAIAVPGVALAQTAEKRGPVKGDWETTLSGAGSSSNEFDNHTFGVTGSVGKYVTDNVQVGVRQTINFADVENGDDITNFATRGFVDYVFNAGNWRPYIGVSFGGIYGENVNDTLAAGPEVGVKYYADKKTFVYLSGEYQFTFDDADQIDDRADDGQFFYGAGIGFNF